MARWDDILTTAHRLLDEDTYAWKDDAASICLAAVEDGVHLGIGRSLHRNRPEFEGPAVEALLAKDDLLDDSRLERISDVTTLEHTLQTTAERFARSWVQGRIREAAKLVLAGEKDEGYPVLLDLTFDIVDRACRVGVGKAMGHQSLDPLTADIAAEEFLTEKLGDAKFIKHVAKAERPAGLVWQAAKNLAFDAAHEVVHLVPAFEDDDGYQEFGKDPARNPEEAYLASEIDNRVRDTQEALEELSFDEILLLEVVFVERCPVPLSHIEEIARRRVLDVTTVQGELEHRKSAQRAKRSERFADRVAQQLVLHRLQELERVAARVVAELDTAAVETQIPHPTMNTRSPAALEEQLRSLSAEERSACLRRLSKRREGAAKKYLDTDRRANAALPARHGYEEVAWILGKFPDYATDAEQTVVVNTITQRFRRARRKMDELAGDRWRAR